MAAQKHGKLQTITIATGIAIAVVLVIAETRWTAAAQTSAKPAREAPKFQVDPAWPKIPNGWVLGQVASAATDEQDNVWVLHRPRVVAAWCEDRATSDGIRCRRQLHSGLGRRGHGL